MKIIPLTLALLSWLCLAPSVRADEKAKAAAMTLGKKLYAACGACHGADGKGKKTWGGRDDLTTAEDVAGWREKYADISKPLTRADFQKRMKAAGE